MYQKYSWISDSRPSIMSTDIISANHGTNKFGDVNELKKDAGGYLDIDFEGGEIDTIGWENLITMSMFLNFKNWLVVQVYFQTYYL
jgi:hypothetical protein